MTDTPLTNKHLKDSEDWVVRETHGQGLHVAACRSIERELRAELASSIAVQRADDDLAMLVRRLVLAVRRVASDDSPELVLANNAARYLQKQGLAGSPLREVPLHSVDDKTHG